MLSAEEAFKYGLANYITTPEQLLDKSIELAMKMMLRGPLALSGVIRSINAYYDKTIEGYSFEARTFGEVAATGDFVEGTKAFIEKRKPAFEGK